MDCPAPRGRQDCAPGVSVELSEIEDCSDAKGFRDDQGVWHCLRTGRIEEVITIEGSTPKTVQVTLIEEGRPIGKRTMQPRYSGVYVNGPDCAPACEAAGEIWELP